MKFFNVFLIALLFVGTHSWAAKKVLRSEPSTGLLRAPPRGYRIYSVNTELFFKTSDICDKVEADWGQMIQFDKLSAHSGVDYEFSIACAKTVDGRTYFGLDGYFNGRNEEGRKFLAGLFDDKVFSFYGSSYNLEPVVSTAGIISIVHYGRNNNAADCDLDMLTGFVPISIFDIEARMDALSQQFEEADGPGRREIELRLALELRPDLSADYILKCLDEAIDRVNMISFDFKPLFQTKNGVQPGHFTWTWRYECSGAGQCYKPVGGLK